MNQFISHILMLLEDNGMAMGYPNIVHADPITGTNDKFNRHVALYSNLSARVSIEQNQKAKFNIIFSILDSFVDTKHPHLEGQTFKAKYMQLPDTTDYEKVLKELYRIAKVIRNNLVHSPSTFIEGAQMIEVSYSFHNTNYDLKISKSALNSFYSAIAMYVKEDMGNGAYFMASVSEIYQDIISGISTFNDDVNKGLLKLTSPLTIRTDRRLILRNPNISFAPDLKIHNDTSKLIENPYEGLDYYFVYKGVQVLIPIEAINAGAINETEALTKWRYQGQFPPI